MLVMIIWNIHAAGQAWNGCQDLLGVYGMHSHDFIPRLLGGFFIQNGVRDGDFADVMQKRAVSMCVRSGLVFPRYVASLTVISATRMECPWILSFNSRAFAHPWMVVSYAIINSWWSLVNPGLILHYEWQYLPGQQNDCSLSIMSGV